MNIELEIAASENNIEAMHAAYKENDQIKNSLAMAAQDGHKEAVEFLLSKVTTDEDKKEGLIEGLFYASQNGFIEMVDLLLENGATFKRKGRSALHAAAGQGHVKIVEKLIAAGMKVDILSIDNTTPLAESVANKQLESVKLLLAKGAKPLLADKFGLTPKDIAMRYATDEIKSLILGAI